MIHLEKHSPELIYAQQTINSNCMASTFNFKSVKLKKVPIDIRAYKIIYVYLWILKDLWK